MLAVGGAAKAPPAPPPFSVAKSPLPECESAPGRIVDVLNKARRAEALRFSVVNAAWKVDPGKDNAGVLSALTKEWNKAVEGLGTCGCPVRRWSVQGEDGSLSEAVSAFLAGGIVRAGPKQLEQLQFLTTTHCAALTQLETDQGRTNGASPQGTGAGGPQQPQPPGQAPQVANPSTGASNGSAAEAAANETKRLIDPAFDDLRRQLEKQRDEIAGLRAELGRLPQAIAAQQPTAMAGLASLGLAGAAGIGIGALLVMWTRSRVSATAFADAWAREGLPQSISALREDLRAIRAEQVARAEQPTRDAAERDSVFREGQGSLSPPVTAAYTTHVDEPNRPEWAAHTFDEPPPASPQPAMTLTAEAVLARYASLVAAEPWTAEPEMAFAREYDACWVLPSEANNRLSVQAAPPPAGDVAFMAVQITSHTWLLFPGPGPRLRRPDYVGTSNAQRIFHGLFYVTPNTSSFRLERPARGAVHGGSFEVVERGAVFV